MKFTDTGNVAV